MVRLHLRQTIQDGMDGSPERSGSFSMNDSNLKDVSDPAFGKVVRDQILQLARIKRVEVENTVDRKLDRFGVFHVITGVLVVQRISYRYRTLYTIL